MEVGKLVHSTSMGQPHFGEIQNETNSFRVTNGALLSRSFHQFCFNLNRSHPTPPLSSVPQPSHSFVPPVSLKSVSFPSVEIPPSPPPSKKLRSLEYPCQWQDCNESFTTRTGLATHCASHFNFESIEEEKQSSLHDMVKNNLYELKCEWRGCQQKYFSSLKEFSKHLAQPSHVGQTPFIVRKNGLGWNDKVYEKKFYCSFAGCGKSFSDASNRKKHERTHESNRERFHCPEEGCDKSYSKRADLRVHLKIHQGDYSYKCSHPYCNKAFVRLSELYTHERSHDNMLPYSCDVCGKKFCEISRLKRHGKLHQPAE